MIVEMLREFAKDEKALGGIITGIVLVVGGMVGLYVGFILIGEFSDTFASVYTGNNTVISDGINRTTSIAVTVMNILSAGMLAWGGFMVISWLRGE
jgi:hypothetical protein